MAIRASHYDQDSIRHFDLANRHARDTWRIFVISALRRPPTSSHRARIRPCVSVVVCRQQGAERVFEGTGVLDGSARPGMRVMFVTEIRTPMFNIARAFESARLVRALDTYSSPGPEDRFEVDFRGERFVVLRREIRLPFGT